MCCDGSVRIGIIGTNFISDWLVAASAKVSQVEITAVQSRTRERGEEFAARHGIGVVHTDLDAMLADSDIDAVYVASPNAVHAEQCLAALRAGKDVLCEKTLGVDAAECATILDAAIQHGRVVLEEVRPLFDPAWQVISDNLPLVGEVRRVAFEKGQYSSRYDKFRAGTIENAFRPELGNSALADIGVYCLQPALDLFGAPKNTTATSIRLHNGFDAAGTLLLSHDDFLIECTYSKISTSVRPSVIEGERGSILIDSVAEPARVEFVGRDGERQPVLDGPPREPQDNLHHALEVFVDLCTERCVEHRWREITMRSRELMDLTPLLPST